MGLFSWLNAFFDLITNKVPRAVVEEIVLQEQRRIQGEILTEVLDLQERLSVGHRVASSVIGVFNDTISHASGNSWTGWSKPNPRHLRKGIKQQSPTIAPIIRRLENIPRRRPTTYYRPGRSPRV